MECELETTFKEFNNILGKLKGNEATGPYEITNELLEYAG